MIAFEGILNGIESTAVFIAVLSILIVVHEWGHFITAKLLGIKVEEFALGFGPTLWSKTYHETNYMLKLFPLGGYVRMSGDERSKCTGASHEYYSKSPGKRALVVFNGPMINFVLAYVSLVFVFMLGYPGLTTRITEVVADGPAAQTQIKPSDEIVAINGKKIYGWLHLERLLEGKTAEPMKVTVSRNGTLIESTIQPTIEVRPTLLGIPTSFRDIGLGFLPNKIGGVGEGSPAEMAGMEADDIVVEIDSKSITNWTSLQEAVATSEGEAIKLKFLRDGTTYEKEIVPDVVETKDENGQPKTVRRLGISPLQDFGTFKFNFVDSLYYGFDELWYVTRLTYESLFRMVTGSVSAKDSVTGPVGIFYIVKGAAEAGLSHLLFILGIISASLAIFNLLPMLPLDGGHLALLAIEKVRGKPLSEKIDEFIARLGFTLIIMLALYVFYSDFSRFGWIDGIIDSVTKLIKLFSKG
ncbi:MAG: RIP metalloprotease RseP [Candidatus Omnitrophica bacterium]|nr:RIP metalloprotease RseP [Candidatus Omnitrophota bacterium]